MKTVAPWLVVAKEARLLGRRYWHWRRGLERALGSHRSSWPEWQKLVVPFFEIHHYPPRHVACGRSCRTGTGLVDQAQNTGKASRTGCRGTGTGHKDLGPAAMEEHHLVLGGSSRRWEAGRRSCPRMILGEGGHSAAQGSSARSNFRSGHEAGKLRRGGDKLPSGWAMTTIDQQRQVGRGGTGVDHAQRRGVPTRHSAGGRAARGRSQTSVGMDTGHAGLHLVAHPQQVVEPDHNFHTGKGNRTMEGVETVHRCPALATGR